MRLLLIASPLDLTCDIIDIYLLARRLGRDLISLDVNPLLHGVQ